jgi:hypothetical protein
MSDPMRDAWKATAAGGSYAPHPALRSLWAVGGGPIAFVRADEQLAERLSRLARDEVPALVREDGRAVSTLTAPVDLSRVAGGAGDTSDTMHEPNDANVDGTEQHRPALSSILDRLRERQQWSARSVPSASSAPSASVRVSKQSSRAPSAPPRQPHSPTSLQVADTMRTRSSTLARDASPATPQRWPQARAVTVGRSLTGPAQPPASALTHSAPDSTGAAPSIASPLLSSPSAVQSMLASYEGGSAPPPHDAAMTAARLLQVTERVERKLAAGRAAAGPHASRRSSLRRGASEDRTSDASDSSRTIRPTGALPADGTTRAPRQAHAALSSSGDLPSAAAPAFGTAAVSTELRGLRGLAMRAAQEATTAGERAPMLQPVHRARRGWDDGDATDAWSLDAAARLEGLDVDEVAS